MAVYLIERSFAEQVLDTESIAPAINAINAEAGVQWLISFLSADKKKTYCLYEAPNVEAIREAARKAGLPADVIIPITEIQSNGKMGEVQIERFA